MAGICQIQRTVWDRGGARAALKSPRSGCFWPLLWWWRGLDSNQRTLARADLQSAAFNHSATSPGAAGAPCGGAIMPCQRVSALCRPASVRVLSLRLLCADRRNRAGDRSAAGAAIDVNVGAGEGNRTLVVSLEGFCSTIELHPLEWRPMPFGDRSRQPPEALTRWDPIR